MAVWLATINGLWYNQATVNTIKFTGPDTPLNLNTFIDALGAEFKTRVQPTTHTSMSYNSINLRKLSPAEPGLSFVPTGWPFVGTLAGLAMPSYVAVQGKLQGSTPNYPFRGSMRLAGVIEEDITSGAVAAGSPTTRWTTAVAFWTVTYTVLGQTWTPVLYTERFAPLANPIASVTLDTRATTQNSRKVGRGG